MRLGIGTLRMVFALFAALMVAGAGVVASASELSEELQHAASHASDNGGQGVAAMVADNQGLEAANHQHPDTPGHSHCGVSCHVQVSDSRVAVAIAFAAAPAPVVSSFEIPDPASHLDGLFRPPRA